MSMYYSIMYIINKCYSMWLLAYVYIYIYTWIKIPNTAIAVAVAVACLWEI